MRKTERKALAGLIDRFLAERRESDGGYAPVTESDLNKLYAIISRLVRMKWGMDPDGDRPIEWKLIDRTRFERMHYVPIPYEHKAKGEAVFDRLHFVALNASIANRDLDTTLKLLEFHRRAEAGKVEKES
jgi:hypothetical protein